MNSQPEHGTGVSRRTFVIGSVATGLAAAAAAATVNSAPADAAQSGWRYCSLCLGLFYPGNGLGVCYGNNFDGHNLGSRSYILKFNADGGNGQGGWYYCRQCALFHYGVGSVGNCPIGVGSRHTSYMSANYRIETTTDNDGSGGQNNWRFCAQCNGLWYNGNYSFGACPGYSGHSIGSWSYVLRY